MAEPITWEALQLIKQRLTQISVANGYRTDLGVGEILTDRARLSLQTQESVTLIVAGDVDTDPDTSNARITNSDMDVTLEFAIRFEAESPELVAHRARADIMQAMSQPLTRDELKCMRSLEITGSRFAQDADEGAILFTLAQVTARAGLTERHAPAQ